MHLLTPFDLVSRFGSERSLVIVGNAPSLSGSGLGPWIDGFDVVVRFNGCALKGFELDVGSRTDILVTNPYPDTFHRPPADGRGCGMILVIAPQTRRGEKAVFADWADGCDVLFTFTPDIYGLEGSLRAGAMTTGVYAISLLRRLLLPSPLAIAGFTMFQDQTAHYWSDEMPAGVARHDLVKDAETLVDLVNSHRKGVIVTSEIDWLAKRIGRPLRKQVDIKALPDPKWASLSGGR